MASVSGSSGRTAVPGVADIELGTVKRVSASSPGLRILMKDLSYHVPSNTAKGERAYLLKEISAFLEPGQMTALVSTELLAHCAAHSA